MKSPSKITVLGSGAFGTALAHAFATQHDNVTLWGRNDRVVKEINTSHTNVKYLGALPLSTELRATTNIDQALENSTHVVYACPSSQFSNFVPSLKDKLLNNPTHPVFVNVAKGIDPDCLSFHSDLAAKIFGEDFVRRQFVCLSGPSFAKEIVQGHPTCVCAAGIGRKARHTTQRTLSTKTFRIYTSNDLAGCQLGGAMKNVIAIAVGVCEGLKLGHNTQAAIINWGLQELTKLGLVLGGKPETFIGLAVLGDLILTCTGSLSRNRAFGILIGKGYSVEDAQNEINSTIEGIKTTQSIYKLAKSKNVPIPICDQIFEILYHKKTAGQALGDLLDQPIGSEWR